MRYFVHLAYNGLSYNGWQKQSVGVSVQSIIEEQFEKIFKAPINTICCGRTDASVHASQFFIHFNLSKEFDIPATVFRLNKTLPNNIVIFDIIPVSEISHARFDATHRRYDYLIHTQKDPFMHGLSCLYTDAELNLNAMNSAVQLFTKYDDYRSFCTSPDSYEHTICRVSGAKLFSNEAQTRIKFQIDSNRFLGKMIRILINKLFEVGRGELSVNELEQHFIDKSTPKLIIPADPRGLYLSKVTYPYLDLPVNPDLCPSILTQHDDWMEIK